MEIRLCKQSEEEESWSLERKVWARFNWEANGAAGVDYFPDLHLVAVEDNKLIATIDACPFVWDGNPKNLPKDGWTGIVTRAVEHPEELDAAQWVGVLGTSIDPQQKNTGMSSKMLVALKEQVLKLGYQGMIAPVRPLHRARMPQLALKEYTKMRLSDGEHYDPWVRVHERLGGEIIGYCHASARFNGTREQWEDWMETKLPSNGKLLVPDKSIGWLKMVDDHGYLSEDSIWIKHQ